MWGADVALVENVAGAPEAEVATPAESRYDPADAGVGEFRFGAGAGRIVRLGVIVRF